MTHKPPTDEYFEQYTWQQERKHDLLKYYLGGWFPKIADLRGRVLYCETHAGKGEHRGGEKGSPIVALETLLNHRTLPDILRKVEVQFLFLEVDAGSAQELRGSIDRYDIPRQVRSEVRTGDFKEVLERALDDPARRGAPALTFIDPFGYDLPLDLILRLLHQPSGEVLVTFMASAVARAMRDPTKESNLTRLYGTNEWRSLRDVVDFEKQKTAAIDLYKQAVGARWCTALRLTGQTDYALMHFTNHAEGRRLMKKAVWSLDKVGGFQVFKTDDPKQLTLIAMSPALGALRAAVREQFCGLSVQYRELEAWLLDTDWRDVHLHDVLRKGKREGWVTFKGRIGPSMAEEIVFA